MKPQGSKRDEAFLTGGRIRSEMPRLAICTTGLYRHTVERLNVGIIGRLTGPRESQHDLVGICPGEARSKECLNWEGRGAGLCQSSVQWDHVGTWGICDVVGPLLHHRSPPLEQIGALIGSLNSFDDMGETGFGHFS